MIGKRFIVTGMQIEVVADKGNKWQVRNLTTGEIVLFDKTVLDKAIRLGKAEEIAVNND